jgi:hypothetical protein
MDITLEQRIAQLVREHGGLRAAGRAIGIDPGYLHHLMTGVKAGPGDETIEKLGLAKKVTYTLKNPIDR